MTTDSPFEKLFDGWEHPCDWCGTLTDSLTEVTVNEEEPEYICSPCVAAIDQTRDTMKAVRDVRKQQKTNGEIQ